MGFASTKVISFRASPRALGSIDRLIASGIAGTTSEVINRALSGDPEVLGALTSKQEGVMAANVAPSYAMSDQAVDMVTEAFRSVVQPAEMRPTGSDPLGYRGVFELDVAVHWTAWVDLSSGDAWLAVTLLGKEHTDWPIANYILREMSDPQLLKFIGKLPSSSQIETRWVLDAWQGAGGRVPRFREQEISGGWVPVSTLGADNYAEMLRIARDGLDPSRGYRGRVAKTITLTTGERAVRHVSPSVQFRASVPLTPGRQDLVTKSMGAARDVLQPLHEFVRTRSA